MKKWLIVFSFAIVLALALTACGGGNNKDGATDNGNTGDTGGNTAAGNVDVNAIYKQNCVVCHGNNLEGKMGEKTNLTKVGARMDRDQIVGQIQNGGNGMMAFKGTLSDDEINALGDWLAAKK